MKRKIRNQMLLLSLFILVTSSLLVTLMMYREFYSAMQSRIKTEAEYMAADLNADGESYLLALKTGTHTDRVTLIASDGQVLFDTQREPEEMENHLDRPEVAQALSLGRGEDDRSSETLGERTYYYALRLDNGNVLRTAGSIGSVYSAVVNCIPYMVMIAAFVFILVLVWAGWQTRRIVAPINLIDLKNPLSVEIYEELSPLLTRILKQNAKIDGQMRELKEKGEEFATITRNMNEGLVILNNKGVVLSVNQSALRIFGAKREECQGCHLLALSRNLALTSLLEESRKGVFGEKTLQMGQRSYQVIASPVKREGLMTGIVLLLLDITEREEAEQMRREFTANVSHELKTPLTSILGYAELMENNLVKPQDLPLFYRRIQEEAGRLLVLIDDIIRLSQLDESNGSPSWEEVNLGELSRLVCQRLQPLAEKKSVSLSVEGHAPPVWGTPAVLEELIHNLCDNAVKYNRVSGSVRLSLSEGKEGGCILQVTDTGIGIPAEHQHRVFERFYRVDPSHSKETGGTGLGLSIVKHAAQYHHASLTLESEEGRGTTVTVVFPPSSAEV